MPCILVADTERKCYNRKHDLIEPKDYEVYDFVLKNYYQLRFSPAVATDVKEIGRNPKRVQREVRKQEYSTNH